MKKNSICDAICACSVAQRGQAVPRLLSTYARELKEVARAFLLIFSPWERNVLFLLGTTYLLGISLCRSFDFFSNCGSLASTACLGYFFFPLVPLLLIPGERLVGNLSAALARGDGWLGAASWQFICFPPWGFKKSDGLMSLESQGGNFPGSIQLVSPLCLAL